MSDPDELARMKLRARAAFVSRYCFGVLGEPVVTQLLQQMIALYIARTDPTRENIL